MICHEIRKRAVYMDDNVRDFIEETINIDELFEDSAEITTSYRVGIIGAKVGFIAKQFYNKNGKEKG